MMFLFIDLFLLFLFLFFCFKVTMTAVVNTKPPTNFGTWSRVRKKGREGRGKKKKEDPAEYIRVLYEVFK